MKTPAPKTLRSIAIVSLVAVPALAEAPKDQYLGFDRLATEIVDLNTQLTWSRAVPLDKVSYDSANGACATPPFNGRLPTVKELLTLIDEQPHTENLVGSGEEVTKLIDANAFPGVLRAGVGASPVDRPYWTSTPTTPNLAGPVWTLSFADGAMAPADRGLELHYYRCVK